MKTWLARRVPPGTDLDAHLKGLLWALAAGPTTNLRFLLLFVSARRNLDRALSAAKIIQLSTRMEPFGILLGWSLYGCFAAAAAMAPLAVWYWRGHYRGSRSIYLMRRLPDRWELPRRCLTVPLLGLAAYLLEAALLLALDFGIYWIFTPGQCLPDNLWTYPYFE